MLGLLSAIDIYFCGKERKCYIAYTLLMKGGDIQWGRASLIQFHA